MKLISVENFELRVADEALLIKPIRMLFNQDRSQKKERFYEQMSYLYFMCDPRGGYNYIFDENERAAAIIQQEGLPSNFKPSALLKEAMEVYKAQSVTVSQKLLESALVAADTVSDFLKNVDLTEEDDKGRPKYQVSAITTALKNVEGIVTSLQNLQRKVDQELVEKDATRGSLELTIFDNAID